MMLPKKEVFSFHKLDSGCDPLVEPVNDSASGSVCNSVPLHGIQSALKKMMLKASG